MSKYTIKIIPENPEDIPDGKEVISECEGVLIVTFNDKGRATTKTMAGCSIDMVAHAIADDADLHAASVIAEGYTKAWEIMRESERDKGMRGIMSAMKAVAEHAQEE